MGWLAAVTAVAALVAAGAEIWRFGLMLEGRTLVLSGAVVRASDVLVAISALAVGVLALVTALLAIPTLVRHPRRGGPADRPGAFAAAAGHRAQVAGTWSGTSTAPARS